MQPKPVVVTTLVRVNIDPETTDADLETRATIDMAAHTAIEQAGYPLGDVAYELDYRNVSSQIPDLGPSESAFWVTVRIKPAPRRIRRPRRPARRPARRIFLA